MPRVGILMGQHAFDFSIIFKKQKSLKPFVTDTFDSYFLPGVGILVIFFFEKCQNPHLMPNSTLPPTHPTSGLTLIGV